MKGKNWLRKYLRNKIIEANRLQEESSRCGDFNKAKMYEKTYFRLANKLINLGVDYG